MTVYCKTANGCIRAGFDGANEVSGGPHAGEFACCCGSAARAREMDEVFASLIYDAHDKTPVIRIAKAPVAQR